MRWQHRESQCKFRWRRDLGKDDDLRESLRGLPRKTSNLLKPTKGKRVGYRIDPAQATQHSRPFFFLIGGFRPSLSHNIWLWTSSDDEYLDQPATPSRLALGPAPHTGTRNRCTQRIGSSCQPSTSASKTV